MNRDEILAAACKFVGETPMNVVAPDVAINDEVIGLRMFELPIMGVADADDPMFKQLLEPSVIGVHLDLPDKWLIGAQSVVSFFLPFTEAVKRGNSRDMSGPSPEWLHARIEGQAMIGELCRHLLTELKRNGVRAASPCVDKRFWARRQSGVAGDASYTSNWSERHAAFICGLGTFGLSKGLITRRGVAGRLASVIVDKKLEPDERPYKEVYEYCIMCGLCAVNCPAHAISVEHGKDHVLCDAFLEHEKKRCAPRYGCGKCQVKVPCESGIPCKTAQN